MSFGVRASLGLNIILLIALGVLLCRRDSVPHITAQSRPPTEVRIAAATAERGAVSQTNAGGTALTPTAVSELRRMGVSLDAIANALIDEHTYRYDKRVRALEKQYAPKPVPRRVLLELSRESDAERTQELKQALGEDGYQAWDKETTLRLLNARGLHLDPDEADKAYRLQKEFDEKNKALQIAKEDGIADPADTNALYEQAQKQLDQQLEALLGKDRFAALRGAPDPLADVSRRFEDLSPTPTQAKAVLTAESDVLSRQAALVQQLKDNPSSAANLSDQLKQLNDAREQNLRQIFGADNYEATKRQNDPTFQSLQQYAQAWDLNDSQVQSVYQAVAAFHDQSDLTRMAGEMRAAAGQDVNWHDVNAGIEQAELQTEANLVNLVGPERARRILQNGLLVTRDSQIKR